MEELSTGDDSNAEPPHQAPKKRRGEPSCSLDGKKHQPPAPDSGRKGKAVRTQTPEIPKSANKQSSPGAPKKPYKQLSSDYQERCASHLQLNRSTIPGSSRKLMNKFYHQLKRY